MVARSRLAVRALLVDHSGALLLLRTRHWGGTVFWLTPGGGVERGESAQDALNRELWEEIGFSAVCDQTEVFHRSFDFDSLQGPVRQHERYFLVRTARFTPIFDNIPTPEERSGILAHHWWTADGIEKAQSRVRFAPRELGSLLRRLQQSE